MEPMEEENYDDDLQLTHKSSLRDKEKMPLKQIVKETYGVQRRCDEQKQVRVNEYI
jgi:hypothetical protein